MNKLKGKRSIDRALGVHELIKANPIATEQEMAFLTRQLVQVTLPHSDPGDVPAWTRENGNVSLSIRPGWDRKNKCSVGYPYGTIPRLLLLWVTTEALRTKSRKIKVGENLADFMREIGLDPSTGGGKNGDAERLKNHMERLFRSTISLEVIKKQGNATGKRWLDMQIVHEGEMWWNTREPDKIPLFGSWIELGERFYDAIITAPVPLDKRALGAIKNSSLALDLYSWATYKTFSLNKSKNHEQFIPWKTFMLQLGSEYNDVKNFKKEAKEAFKKVKLIYPGLNMEIVDGGFIIKKGEPAIYISHEKTKFSTENMD